MRAGKNPPTTPITTANTTPDNSSSGVTRKANAISMKLDQFVVLVTTPLMGWCPQRYPHHRYTYPQKMYATVIAAATPTASANSPITTACRVFRTPTEPKYKARM